MIGEKVYQVNRDDRYSSVENHRFNIWTVVAVISYKKGYIFSVSSSPSVSSRGSLNFNFDTIDEHPKVIRNDFIDSIVVHGKDLKEAVDRINTLGLGGNFYLDRDKSKDEIKRLVSSQLEETERQIKFLNKSKKQLEELLKEKL